MPATGLFLNSNQKSTRMTYTFSATAAELEFSIYCTLHVYPVPMLLIMSTSNNNVAYISTFESNDLLAGWIFWTKS